MPELALQLIAKEKKEKTGILDLGNCGLEYIPEEVFSMHWLEVLSFVPDYWHPEKKQWVTSTNKGPKNFLAHTALPEGFKKLAGLKEFYYAFIFSEPQPLQELGALQQLSGLQRLDLGYTNVNDLTPLSGLSGLQQLVLGNTNVNDLTPLSGLSGLQRLDLENTKVNDLTPLSGLSGLQDLYLRNTNVNDLTPLSGLSGLQELGLSETQVRDLSPLSRLSGLQLLDLGNTNVNDLTPLSGLSGLQYLYLRNTNVNDLTPLSGLSGLQYLYLRNTKVNDLTPLSGLSGLQYLYLRNTKVNDLTPLSGLSGLQRLDLGNTNVNDLTPLSGLSGLQELGLSETQVRDLSPLSGLSGLQRLDLGNTNVNDLTPLSGLSGLQELYLSGTPVSNLSPLSGLSDIQYINLLGTRVNDYKALLPLVKKGLEVHDDYFRQGISVATYNAVNPPPEIIKMGREAFLGWFAQMESQGEATLLEGRLVIAGEPKAGKTTLFRKLFDENIPVPDKKQGSTHGIQIAYNRPFAHTNKYDEIQAHVWDFGGQFIQTYLHQYFFTKGNLVVLVTDLREEKTPFDYWFEIISRLCSGSKVLVVGNLHGRTTAMQPFNLNQYRERYTGLQLGYLEVDFAVNDARWALLKEQLGKELSALRVVNQKVPALWKAVSRLLLKEKEKQPYVSWEAYRAICEEKGIKGEHFQRLLIGYLTSLGYAVYFDELGLSNTVFLDPQWMIDGLYEILKDKAYDEHYPGRFDKKRLYTLWQRKGYKKAERDLLLSLLLKDRFEVCYPLEGTDYLLAPLFLSNIAKEIATDALPEGRYTLRFSFPFMPFGFFSRLIVRLHHLIWDNQVWLTGVWLKDTRGCYALLSQFKDPQTGAELIEVAIYGPQHLRINLLERVRQEIFHIKERLFKNLIIEEQIPCPCNKCAAQKTPDYHSREKLDNILSDGGMQSQCDRGSMIMITELLNSVIDKKALENYLKEKGVDKAEKIKLEVNPVFHNMPQFTQETKVSTYVTINMQLINDFKETLQMTREDIGKEAALKKVFEKEALEELQADLKITEEALAAYKEGEKPSKKTKSRLKQFGEAMINEDSNLRKALKLLKQGKDYGVDLAEAYNIIAANIALPSVPPVVLKVLKKL
jgi:internalin A